MSLSCKKFILLQIVPRVICSMGIFKTENGGRRLNKVTPRTTSPSWRSVLKSSAHTCCTCKNTACHSPYFPNYSTSQLHFKRVHFFYFFAFLLLNLFSTLKLKIESGRCSTSISCAVSAKYAEVTLKKKRKRDKYLFYSV